MSRVMPLVNLLAIVVTLAANCLVSRVGAENLVIKQSKAERILELVDAFLMGQKNEDAAQNPVEFRTWALEENTSEDFGRLSTQEIIASAGFEYENHYVTSDDGYISCLIRIINPLADRSKLKQPPVMIAHGGIIDSSAWVWVSSERHHPEKYPRTLHDDGPITSWNRSLALTLANNGYDVWLAGTRGSNEHNNRHTKFKKHLQFPLKGDSDRATDSVIAESEEESFDHEDKSTLQELFDYWDYSMDDISTYEIPKQINYILDHTRAKKITYVVYSLSSQTSLQTLSSQPKIRAKIHNYVVFAPIITETGTNNALKFAHNLLLTLPVPMGTLLADALFSHRTRDLVLNFSKDMKLRYTFFKAVTRNLCGPSAKYQSSLGPAVLGNIFKATGFKELKHYAQQSRAGKIQKFDYGPLTNKIKYGSIFPPAYDLGEIKLRDYFLVTAQNDMMAPPSSTSELLKTLGTKPWRHIDMPHWNHVDLVTSFDNDVQINLPVLEYLETFQLKPLNLGAKHRKHHRESTSYPRSADFDRLPLAHQQTPSYNSSNSL